jgi:hypothetical protein
MEPRETVRERLPGPRAVLGALSSLDVGIPVPWLDDRLPCRTSRPASHNIAYRRLMLRAILHRVYRTERHACVGR